MKQIFITIAVIVALPLLSFGQQRWTTIIGQPNKGETSIASVKTYDNGYCLLNYLNEGNIYLVKTDINGNILWEKTIIDPEGFVGPTSICEDNNGELILSGYVINGAILIKLSSCGEVIWCSKFINPEYNLISFDDAVTLDNGDIILLAFMQRIDGDVTNQVYLFCYDTDGSFLWKKPYASLDDHPLFGDRMVYNLYHFNNYFIAVGNCYYPLPENPEILALRPFFIRIDNTYNEVFVLPYGVEDSIIGVAWQLKDTVENNINIGIGSYFPYTYSGERNALVMKFDSLGNETGHWGIPNESIGSDVNDNLGYGIVQTTDSTEIITGPYGIDYTINPIGELLVDTAYAVIGTLTHPNTIGNTSDIVKAPGSTLVFATSQMELPSFSYNDILLYKLNADLSQADYDSTTCVYDSLCDHPIVSDTIYLDGCDVITGIDEVPGPREYYSALKTIPVRISPNPAKNAIVFELENTKYNKNIILRCYNLEGGLVFEQALKNGETSITTSVSNWQKGIYIAKAYSSNGSSGSGKFVVYH